MSDENRAVFAFYKDVWRATKIRMERPERNVVLLYNDGGELFDENAVPAFSQRYQKKVRLAQMKLAEQDRKSILRAEKKKEKRKRAKTSTLLPKRLTFVGEAVKLKNDKVPLAQNKRKKLKVEADKAPLPIEAAMNELDTDIGEFPVYTDIGLNSAGRQSQPCC